MLKGIDIAAWQAGIQLNNLNPKPDFCIIKATEGVGYIDPQFQNNNAQLFSSGVLRGYYHFARPDLGNLPEAEAQSFVDIAKPERGEILVLDYEVNYGDAVNWCLQWLLEVERLTNNKPLLYINASTEKSIDWSPVVNNNNGLWLAIYDNNENIDNIALRNWSVVAMKQYTSSGRLDGWNGDLDFNAFYGDLDTWNKYAVGYIPTETPNNSNNQNNMNTNTQLEELQNARTELNKLQLDLQNAKAEVQARITEEIALKDKIAEDQNRIFGYETEKSEMQKSITELQTQLETCNKTLKDKVKDAGLYSGVSVIIATILGNILIQTGVTSGLPVEQLVGGLTVIVNMILIPILSKISNGKA